MKDTGKTVIKNGYKKTKLGWIPEDWKIKSLDDIGDFSKGKGISKLEITSSGKPCIRYAEIYTKYDFYTDHLESYISEESALNSREIFYGDLLFAGSGETLEDIGKCVAYLGKEEAFAGGDIVILSPKQENSMYLGFLLNHAVANGQKHKLGQGHSVVHIYSSGLKKLKVPLPPIKEQQKIATILSTWDRAIAKKEQLITAKQEFKKGLMQLLLTGKKRFEGFEGEWGEVKLGSVTTINPKAETLPDEFIYIDLESVKGGKLTKRNMILNKNAPSRAQRLLKSADILFQTVRPYQRNNLFYELDEFSVASTGYAQIRTKQNARYIYHLLHTDYFVNKVLARCTGTSFPAVSPTDLKKIKIRLPNIKEQQKIASVLSAADKEIGILQSELATLRGQKRRLMQRLLTGEVRVKIN